MNLRGRKILTISVEKIVAYSLAICIITSNATMYITLTISPLEKNYMALLVCIFSAIGILLYCRISCKALVWIALLAVYYLLYILVTSTSYTFFLYTVIPLLAIFLYFYAASREGQLSNFTKAFVNVMVIEAAISSFCYIFGTILGVLPGRTILTYQWASATRKCATYFFAYFDNTTQMQTYLGTSIMRNTGIFTEAPGHSGMLIYAMVFEILQLKRSPAHSKKKTVILTIAMLTTLSTKAFLVLMIMFLCWYLMSIKQNERNKVAKYVLLAVAVSVSLYIAQYILIDKSSTGSFLIRMDDLYSQLKAWWGNPLFGVGYSNNDEILQYAEISRSNNGLSMGITVVLAQGGVYLFAIYIIAAVRYFISKRQDGEVREAVFVIATLGANFFISNCGFTLPFLMFVCIGLSMEVKRKSKCASTVCRADYGIVRRTGELE